MKHWKIVYAVLMLATLVRFVLGLIEGRIIVTSTVALLIGVMLLPRRRQARGRVDWAKVNQMEADLGWPLSVKPGQPGGEVKEQAAEERRTPVASPASVIPVLLGGSAGVSRATTIHWGFQDEFMGALLQAQALAGRDDVEPNIFTPRKPDLRTTAQRAQDAAIEAATAAWLKG